MKIQYNLSMWNYEAYVEFETLEAAVENAKNAGYGVEVWPSWKGGPNLFAPENREALVGLIRDIPSSLHGAGIKTLEEHKVQIDAAADTESTVIVVHADSLRGDENSIDAAFTRDVVAYATERKVKIALENGHRAGRLDPLTRAIEAVEGLRICIDIGHVFATDNRPFEEYMDRLGSRIVHLHLQDVYLLPGTMIAEDDNHRTPGQCDIPLSDWELLFSTLKKHNYEGYGVLEVRPFTPDEVAGQAVKFLDFVRETEF